MELTEERLTEIERDAVNDPYDIHPNVVLALVAEVRRLRKILDGEHHKPGAFDRMTDWAQQMENERDEARAEVERLRAEVAALEAERESLLDRM